MDNWRIYVWSLVVALGFAVLLTELLPGYRSGTALKKQLDISNSRVVEVQECFGKQDHKFCSVWVDSSQR